MFASSAFRPYGVNAGAPTLGGPMPTQVSAMLGSILRTEDAKLIPCGAYGSFGWSGEAVDKLHTSLADAGFNMAFKPIKVQFRPTAKDIQVHLFHNQNELLIQSAQLSTHEPSTSVVLQYHALVPLLTDMLHALLLCGMHYHPAGILHRS